MLTHLLYLSRAAIRWSRSDLTALASQAQHDNRRRGLTGLLVHGGGHFIQVLEGDAAHLQALFARIRVDPRHQDVQVFLHGRIARRTFGDWAMGFIDVDGNRVAAIDRERFHHLRAVLAQSDLRVSRNGTALALLTEFRAQLAAATTRPAAAEPCYRQKLPADPDAT